MIAAQSQVAGFLRSPASGATSEQWTRFVHALSIDVCELDASDAPCPWYGLPRPIGAITRGECLGAFGLRRARFVELGSAVSERKFLASPLVQYNALVESTRRYNTTLVQIPADMTRSGALALLHRLGAGAIEKWESGPRNKGTVALFERANGLF